MHALVAMFITGHVLLTKRDIGASIGWIGIAWLSPFVGGVFYLTFGINRVVRRAQRLRPGPPGGGGGGAVAITRSRDDHLTSLDRAAYRLTRRRTEIGNTVTV